MDKEYSDQTWDLVIESKNKFFNLNLKEIWEYKDLVWIFVKRDLISMNKQTILGPLWFFLAPLFTVVIYTFVFSEIANISTDGIPGPLFYLAGTTLWNYFQSCFIGTSSTFTSNANLFGKVYFPRIVIPLSLIISGLLKFSIQFIMFLGFVFYYYNQNLINPNYYIFCLPFLILLMAGIALGTGLIITSLTTKYRDLTYFISFGISLLMYITPVIYPISTIPNSIRFLVEYNPISPIIETFRFSFTGHGTFYFFDLLYSFIFMLIILLSGLTLFNKMEKTFMDTV